jgi:transposase
MSKGRYHSVECKQVAWRELVERTAGEEVIFAVDVAKYDFVGLLMLRRGGRVERIRWRHPEQTRELLNGLGQLAAVARVEAAMESSGTYGDALRWQLARLGIVVYRVSAKRVHDAAEVYDGVASLHDAKAVELIGELHARGLSERWEEQDPARRALQAELAMLRQVKEQEQRVRNRLEAALSRYWPEVLGPPGPRADAAHRPPGLKRGEDQGGARQRRHHPGGALRARRARAAALARPDLGRSA